MKMMGGEPRNRSFRHPSLRNTGDYWKVLFATKLLLGKIQGDGTSSTSATADGSIFQMVMPKAASEELECVGFFKAVAATLVVAGRSTGRYMVCAKLRVSSA
jgi:hypothetical protein